MNFNEYRAAPGVNWTSLKHLRESPLKYRHMLTGPDKDTAERALGRAVHARVFEPAIWERDFIIYDQPKSKGEGSRTAWKAFQAEHTDKTILAPDDIEDIMGMSNAVRTHPIVAPYLDGGVFEQSVAWDDPETGLPCKARMDFNNESMGALIDLKTSTTIDQFRFGRIAARLGYHCQMAHYRNGVEYGLGWLPQETLIIAVESSAPYEVAIFTLDEDVLYAGGEEVRTLLQRLKEYREADIWPSRYPTKTPLMLPAWVYGEEDEGPEGSGIKFNAGE